MTSDFTKKIQAETDFQTETLALKLKAYEISESGMHDPETVYLINDLESAARSFREWLTHIQKHALKIE